MAKKPEVEWFADGTSGIRRTQETVLPCWVCGGWQRPSHRGDEILIYRCEKCGHEDSRRYGEKSEGFVFHAEVDIYVRAFGADEARQIASRAIDRMMGPSITGVHSTLVEGQGIDESQFLPLGQEREDD